MTTWSRGGAVPATEGAGRTGVEELLRTSPDRTGALARDVSTIARTVQEQCRVLEAVDPDRFWEGPAAREFDSTRSSLVPLLDLVAERHTAAATALAAYEPELHDARQLALRALQDRAEAEAQLRRAEDMRADPEIDILIDPTVGPRGAVDDADRMLQEALDAFADAAGRTSARIDAAAATDLDRSAFGGRGLFGLTATAGGFFRPEEGDGGPGTVIPAENTDPAAVARWWASLSDETREQLMRDHYEELGQLRGLPAEVLDEANRQRVAHDITTLEERHRLVSHAIQGQSQYEGGADPALLREQARLADELANAKKIDAQMRELDGNSPPPAHLLTYSPQGDGRFAVALGNPDRATNTAVVVAGTGHDVRNEPTGSFSPVTQDGMNLYNQMRSETGGSDHSVIVWMGTDMPNDIPEASNGTYGDQEHGAARLNDDVAGYQASHAHAPRGDGGHMTVVGHSYGSYVAGQAAEMGMRVDDLVLIGSPGVGAVSVDGLGMPSNHVWAGAAEGLWWGDGDVVSDLGRFGPSPTRDYFGATVFDTSDSVGHSEYYKEGSQSLRNIGRIAVGDTDDLERRPPD